MQKIICSIQPLGSFQTLSIKKNNCDTLIMKLRRHRLVFTLISCFPTMQPLLNVHNLALNPKCF